MTRALLIGLPVGLALWWLWPRERPALEEPASDQGGVHREGPPGDPGAPSRPVPGGELMVPWTRNVALF